MSEITVGLCVRNSAKKVQSALSGIMNQDFQHSLMELVVVNDGSTDETESIIRRSISRTDIKTVIFSTGGKGLGTARQIVVDNANSEYIVWVDDDLELMPDFIRMHKEFMDNHPIVGAASCKAIPSSDNIVSLLSSVGFLLLNRVPAAIGTGGSIFRVKALNEVGGFDKKISGAGEDWDVSYRMRESGWILAVNEAAVLRQKHPPKTLNVVWRKHRWYGYANHMLYHKFVNQKLLAEKFPLKAFVGGVRDSCKIYRLMPDKKVFLLAFHVFFTSIAEWVGFIHAEINGYGH